MLQPPETLPERYREAAIDKWPDLEAQAKEYAGRAHRLIFHIGAGFHEAIVYQVNESGEIVGQEHVQDWREFP